MLDETHHSPRRRGMPEWNLVRVIVVLVESRTRWNVRQGSAKQRRHRRGFSLPLPTGRSSQSYHAQRPAQFS